MSTIHAAAMVAACMGTLTAASASAGVYTDDLSKCLVAKTSATEKTMLIEWLFASISAHPAVKSMSTVTQTQRDDYNKRFGELAQTLLTARCRPESVAALKYEGGASIEAGFAVLGQVAMRELMADPAVASGMGRIDGAIDSSAMKALLAEAGIKAEK